MPRLVLLGANGMFGKDAVPVFEAAGYEVVGADLPEADITSAKSLAELLDAHPPSVVVNAAAFTDVDGAESSRDLAFEVNGLGAHMVAEACRQKDALLVQISTDYVFPGEKPKGYLPRDPMGPAINAYGESKMAGEAGIRAAMPGGGFLICRTQWLYGRGGKNFVDTIRALAATRSRIRVVDDQWGVPTHTVELARQMIELLAHGARGVAHTVGGGGPITWHTFAREIVALSGLSCEVIPCTSEAFPRPARRPHHAWLRSDTYGTAKHWKDSLAQYMTEGVP